MRVKCDDEKIWYLYEKLMEYQVSNVGLKKFCENNGLNIKIFTNFNYTFSFNRKNKPGYVEEMQPYIDEMNRTWESATSLIKKYNLEGSDFRVYVRHLKYQEIIKRLKQIKKNERYLLEDQQEKEENSTMEFVKVNSDTPKITHVTIKNEPELVEKQNDLEIIISKGIKVSISPNIEPMNVIKLIELLRAI